MSFLDVCINSDCNIVSYVSKYAITHGLMHSPLGHIALYCKLRYDVDVSTMSSLKFSPGNHIWCHYLSIVSPELINKVVVLMDMVMLRENSSKGDFILSNEEIRVSYSHFVYGLSFDTFFQPSFIFTCVFVVVLLCIFCVFLFVFCTQCTIQ